MSHPLLFSLVLLFLSSPAVVVSPPPPPLSTVAISHVSNQTVVCALVRDNTATSGDENYVLNCTALPTRFNDTYPSRGAYYSGITGGDGFLCALSTQPTTNTAVMRWWEFPKTNGTEPTVKRIYKGEPLRQLASSDSHVCGLLGTSGSVYCWRWPEFSPPNIDNLSDIAVGSRFVCVLEELGTVGCYGDDGSVVGSVPVGEYTVLAAGGYHACGLSKNGSLDCWGSGAPQIGGDVIPFEFVSLAAGRNRTCALRQNGTAACWGGDGDSFDVPQRFRTSSFLSIKAKGNVFCGILTGNYSLVCWGSEELHSNPMVFDEILPGPCVPVPSCPCGFLDGSGNLCKERGVICKPCTLQRTTPPTPPDTPVQPPPPPPPPRSIVIGGGGDGSRKRRTVYMVLGSAGLGLGLVSLLGFLFFGYCREKWRCQVHDSGPLEELSPPPGILELRSRLHEAKHPPIDRRLSELLSKGHSSTIEEFPFQLLSSLTNGFSDDHKIGSGSFGSVYRAVLDDDREVAIKRAESLPSSSGARVAGCKCDDKEHAFLAELGLLSRVNHRNLVRLLGFCREESELVLVYEYMANGTLHDHLLKLSTSPLASWGMRLRAALDAARGVEYLHRYAVPAIIHRDIKSSNILLDDTWTAKVADFGLGLIGPDDDTSHISQRAAGTVGYMDPEYYRTQCLTTKSDVYSFGVVLLELLTGCKAIHRHAGRGRNLDDEATVSEEGDEEEGGSLHSEPRNVVDFAVPHIINDELPNVLDPKLPPPRPSEIEAVQQLAYLAADCVRHEGRERPDMTEVVYNLERALAACSAPPLIRSMTTHSV